MRTEHRHRWQIRFATRNVFIKDPDQYWYVFTCADWKCPGTRRVDRGKFWRGAA